MKTTFAAVLTTTIVLGGCAGSPMRQRMDMEAQQKANAEVMQRANAARAACEAQYPNAHVKKVDCLTQAENTIFLPIYRYGDLLALFQAQRKP
jgi:hypothetical protein